MWPCVYHSLVRLSANPVSKLGRILTCAHVSFEFKGVSEEITSAPYRVIVKRLEVERKCPADVIPARPPRTLPRLKIVAAGPAD